MMVTLAQGDGIQPPPWHAWNKAIVSDIVHEWLSNELREVRITVPGEAILFFGCRSESKGLNLEEAKENLQGLPKEVTWAGKPTVVTARVISLYMANAYVKMAKEYTKTNKKPTKVSKRPGRSQRLSRNTNTNAAMHSASSQDEWTESWVQDQNRKNDRKSSRKGRSSREPRQWYVPRFRDHNMRDGRHPGGGDGDGDGGDSDGGDSDDDWDGYTDPPDTEDDRDDGSMVYYDTTQRSRVSQGSARSTLSGGGGRRWAANPGKPTLPLFGGMKDEITYHTWRCHVMALKNNGHSDQAILTAIQNSLRGYPGEYYATIAAWQYDPLRGGRLTQVVADLDRHFGFSTNYDGMMSELYKMKQEPYELVSYFGIRLQ